MKVFGAYDSCPERVRGAPGPTMASVEPAVPGPAQSGAASWLKWVAVITGSYGQGNRLRVDAHRRALVYWRAQRLPFLLVFVELLQAGEESAYADLLKHPDDRHIILRGGTEHRSLMQKEAMANIGAWQAIDALCGILVFLDADSWTADRDWLGNIQEKLHPRDPANWDRLVQPWGEFRDTHPAVDRPAHRWGSLARAIASGVPQPESAGSPGLCWAMTSAYFEAIGGLNPFGISGSGDNLLVWELLDPGHVEKARCGFAFFREIARRDLPRGRLDWLNTRFTHEFHGWFRDRAYWYSRQIIDLFLPMRTLVRLDDQGLLVWARETPLADILGNKAAISTPRGYCDVCRRYGLTPNLPEKMLA